MWAIVPIKQLEHSKQRLAESLEPAERYQLSCAMLKDVLTALMGCPLLDGTLVVAADETGAAIARAFGARVIHEKICKGLNPAISYAAQVLNENGVGGILIVPADIPGATSNEFSHILANHGPSPGLTIVPAEKDHGTNCLVCTPHDVIRFCFGSHSSLHHLEAAAKKGIEARIMNLRGIGLDIDQVEDLITFWGDKALTHTGRYLAKSGVMARLLAHHVYTNETREMTCQSIRP